MSLFPSLVEPQLQPTDILPPELPQFVSDLIYILWVDVETAWSLLRDLDGAGVFIHGFNEGVHALVRTHEPVSDHVGFPRQQAEREDVQHVNAACLC